MDELNSQTQSLNKIRSAYKYYCYIVLTANRPRFRLLSWFFQVNIVMQTFTILVNPDSKSGLPWNYASLEYLWLGIGFVSRPDFLAKYFSRELAYSIIFLALLIGCIVTKLCILLSIYFKLRKEIQFSIDNISIRPIYTKLDIALRFLLFDLGLIGSLFSLPLISSAFFFTDSVYFYTLLISLTAVFSILCIEDSLFLQKVTWEDIDSGNTVSMPWLVAIKRLFLLLIVYSVNFIDYDSNWVSYSCIMIGMSSFLLYQFIKNFPYSSFNRNFLEIGKSFIIAWGGLVMLIAETVGFGQQDSYASTIVMALPLGCMLYLMRNKLNFRYNSLKNTKKFECFNQLFHILIEDVRRSDRILTEGSACDEGESMDEVIKGFMNRYPSNAYITLWLCFYYISKQNFMPIRILVSKLENQKFNWIVFSYKKLIMESLKLASRNNPEENEAVTFIDFCQKLATLINSDKKACMNLNSFYVELLSRSPESSRISSIIEKVYQKVRATHLFYKKINSLYDYNPKVLDYYAGFLDSVENSLEYKHILNKAVKAHNEELTKYNVFELDALYFDSRNTIIIVSLDPETAGEILWLKNAGVLGYVESELEKFSFKTLIPEPIRFNHDPHFAKCYNIWGKHLLLYGVWELYVVDRNQYLNSAFVKSRLVNLNNGKKTIILAVKPNMYGEIVAFMSLDGRYMCGFTKEFAIYVCSQLDYKEEQLNTIDILDTLNISEWQTGCKLFKGYSRDCGCDVYVSTENLKFGSYFQKVLKLMKSNGEPVMVKEFQAGSRHIEVPEILPIHPHSKTTKSSNYNDTKTQILTDKSQIQHTDLKIDYEEMSSINLSSTNNSLNENVLKTQKHKVKLAIYRRVRYLKIGIFLFSLITVVLSTIIVSIYKLSIMESDYNTELIADFGEITLSSIRLSSLAKELYLNDQGIYFNRTREIVKNRLIEESSYVTSKLTDLMKYENSQEVNDFLDQFHVAYWEYELNDFSSRFMNVLDFTRKISNKAKSLSGSLNVTADNKDLLEVYRNGNGKIQKVWNTTTFELIDFVEKSIEDKFYVVYYICYASVAVMAFSIVILVVIPLYKLHMYRARLWKNLFNIPRSTLINGLNKVKSRLTEVHDEEPVGSEDTANPQVEYKVHIKQKVIYGMVFLLVVGITIYLIFTNYSLLPDVIDLLDRNILAIAWSKVKNVLSYKIMFLLKENAFGTGIGLSNIAGYDSFTETQKILEDLKYANSECIHSSELSEEIWNYHFDSFEGFKYGYHTYTIELITRISNNNQLLSQKYNYFDIGSIKLESDIRKSLLNTEDLLDLTIQKYDQMRLDNFNYFLTCTILMMLGMVLYVFLGIFSMINNLRDLLLKESTVMIILPKTNSAYILQTFKKILNS